MIWPGPKAIEAQRKASLEERCGGDEPLGEGAMVTTAGAKEVRSNSQVRISRQRPIGEITLLILGLLALLAALLMGVPSAKGH